MGGEDHGLWQIVTVCVVAYSCMHADAAQPDTPVRYIRFPQLLAGRGGADHAGVVGQLTDPFDYKVLIRSISAPYQHQILARCKHWTGTYNPNK